MSRKKDKYDVCIIGSGAGAGPIAYSMAMAGKRVVVLEKGGWFTEKDFAKDEIGTCRRELYSSHINEEPHVIEDKNNEGEWKGVPSTESGWSFWNGNVVGGSSNFMSGYFHRMKEVDFRLLSEFGPVEGANVVDWPLSYEEMECWYTQVEEIVGVSGRIVDHPNQEKRSNASFPFPPLVDHPLASWIDSACSRLGYHSMPMPRAILSQEHNGRSPCSYSVFCGSYGCNTGAKGSARAALLVPAAKTGNLRIITYAMAYKLETDTKGNVEFVRYFDEKGNSQNIYADTFVVACQAVETSRLLLMSKTSTHPDGIGNKYGQVGKNLIFSGGGLGHGDLFFDDLAPSRIEDLKTRGPFINRSLQDWYTINDPELGYAKGGTIDFLHDHPNPIRKANKIKSTNGRLLWGKELQNKLERYFLHSRRVAFEVFNDWLPNDNCFVSLDPLIRDKWGLPVAKIRIGYHRQDVKIGHFLAEKAVKVLKEIGVKDIYTSISGAPPANLQAGGCRFGTDPKQAVLDKNCLVYGTENLFVTDGSFMPTGGSVPFTWTIYANSFRVADFILKNTA